MTQQYPFRLMSLVLIYFAAGFLLVLLIPPLAVLLLSLFLLVGMATAVFFFWYFRAWLRPSGKETYVICNRRGDFVRLVDNKGPYPASPTRWPAVWFDLPYNPYFGEAIQGVVEGKRFEYATVQTVRTCEGLAVEIDWSVKFKIDMRKVNIEDGPARLIGLAGGLLKNPKEVIKATAETALKHHIEGKTIYEMYGLEKHAERTSVLPLSISGPIHELELALVEKINLREEALARGIERVNEYDVQINHIKIPKAFEEALVNQHLWPLRRFKLN